jgi:NAD(P)H-dependent FMN reductase
MSLRTKLEKNMSLPKIGIIIGSTRDGRFADKPAEWIFAIAQARGDADYEVLDLRDFPLPFFNEPASPIWVPPANETAKKWAAKLAEMDGFIFITAEYNHGISGVLKNAIDHAYAEFNRKPAAFVGYGGVGAARAIEQLRQISVEVQLAPLRNAVHIGMVEFVGLLQEGKSFEDFPHLAESAKAMLDDLSWWTSALSTARQAK